jgi:hypothetical protein
VLDRGRGTARTGANDGLGAGDVLSAARGGFGGGTLIVAEGRSVVGFGGGFRRERRDAGWGGALGAAGGRDVAGRGASATTLDLSTAAGAGVLVTALSGTLWDSGASSQPASMSSAGIRGFWVPSLEPSAPKAIFLRYPMRPIPSQRRPYVLFNGPRCRFL